MEASLPPSLRWMAVASPQGGALSLSLQPEAFLGDGGCVVVGRGGCSFLTMLKIK